MSSDTSYSRLAETRLVCLVFDSDSQYFACRNLVPYFSRAGWRLKFIVLGSFDYAGMAEAGIEILRVASMAELKKLPELLACDVIGPYLSGSKLRSIWSVVNGYFAETGTRPLLFCGYNGLIIQGFEDGVSWRTGYDLIALNSPEDRNKAIALDDHCAVAHSGLMPIIGIDRTNKSCRLETGSSGEAWRSHKQVVFAEQVLFPESNNEKFYLYSHLVRIAMENPDWQIVIKPRTLPGGKTFHQQEEHISNFIHKRFILPKNLSIRYEPLAEILLDSTALLSISSTAFFDAVGLGVPAYILSDFGISNTYGTHYFHGSGCSICVAEISRLTPELFAHRPSDEWLRFKGFSPEFSPMAIVEGLDKLITEGTATMPLAAFNIEQRLLAAPAVLPMDCLTLRAKLDRLFRNKSGKRPKSIRRVLARLRRKFWHYGRTLLGGPSPKTLQDESEGPADV
jgi:hypothetical protein